MKVVLSIWAFIALTTLFLALFAENIYLANINASQQHTIRQTMGLENGPDATPYTVSPQAPSMPMPSKPQMPEYVPSPDLRKI